MGNKRSKPLNTTKISNKLITIAKRNNKFGFIYSVDKVATDACTRLLTENTINVDGVEQDIVCKGEARTKWITTIITLQFITFLTIAAFTTIYIISYNKTHKENNLHTSKVITVYIIIAILFIISIIHQLARGNTTNFQSDEIIYWAWQGRENKDQNLLKVLNPDELLLLRDKLNIQHCKNIDLNECSKERVNLFYSLQDIKNNDVFKQKIPDLAKDGWEWKGYKNQIPEKVKKIYSDAGVSTIKIGKIQKKMADGTVNVVESPFLLVGAPCIKEKDTCKSPNLQSGGVVVGTIDNIVSMYTAPSDSSVDIVKSVDPNINPDNQAAKNAENFTKLSQSTRCIDRGKDFCEIGVDGEGDILCEWNDTQNKCKNKWKPGRGYELWSCDLCDNISKKCSLEYRTRVTAISAMTQSILYLVIAFVAQYILKEDDENKFQYTMRSLVVVISYSIFYFMGIAFAIFNTLRLVCPDGSDMGIIGRTDTNWYYKWFVVFNPWKTGEMFELWMKEFKVMWYNPLIILIFGIIATIFLLLEFGWEVVWGSLIGSFGYAFINWLIIFIISKFQTPWNGNNIAMSMLIGWGIGILGGSIWGMLKKLEDRQEPNNT